VNTNGDGQAMRAAGYSRTSGEGQRDNTSIPRQKEDIEAMCRTEGWTLVRHYEDECKSGAKVEGRDSFKRMLADAARGGFDLIVFYDASRLGRDGVDILSTAKFLKGNFGIHSVDTKRQFDSRDRRKVLTNFVHAGVAEDERLRIMERMLGARVARAKAGLPWAGNPPVGRAYRKTCGCTKDCRCGKGEWYVTEQGKRIAELLTRYANGELLRNLHKEYGYLREEHVIRHIREGQLSAAPFVVTFNSPEVGIDDERVEVPSVPPVITADLYERVRERMAKNRKCNDHNHRYPLTSFLHCGNCGRTLFGSTVKGNTYYRHHPKSGSGGHECGWTMVRGDRIEGPVLDYLYGWFTDQPAFDMAVKLALPSAEDREDKLGQLSRAEADLKATEREIANLVEAIAKGVDPSLLVDKQAELKASRDSLRQRLGIVQGELASLPDPSAIQAEAATLRKQLERRHTGKDWRNETPESLERFLEFLFGTSPKRDELGIYIHRNGDALTTTIRARLYLRSPSSTVEGADTPVQFVGGMMGNDPFEQGDLWVGWQAGEVGAENSSTTSPTAPMAMFMTT
jgi:site-specific DNA recombinase